MVKAGVVAEPAGTTTEPPEPKPSAEKVEPPAETEVSQKEEPIYTQTQMDALIHAERSESGRKIKDAETERDSLQSKVKTLEGKLTDNAEDIKELEGKLDDMAKDDPERLDFVKELKGLRDERRSLKDRISDLDDRETKLSEREKKVNSFEREVLIETIADEFEDGDSERLKRAVSGFENPTEEQIRTIAEIFWTKKEGGEKKEPKAPKPYSGKNTGGSPYFTRTQIADRKFWEENKEEILKAQAEGRIRDE